MNILLLAPPSLDRETIVAALTEPGHDVTIVETSTQASITVDTGAPEIVIADLAGGGDVLKFLRKFTPNRGNTHVLCIADRRRVDAAAEALRLGAADILARPVNADDLTTAVANLREFTRVASMPPPLPQAPERQDAVFGNSPAMRDVLGIAARVAPSRCGVLIVGERGTGRELIARTIHGQGPRRDKPFVRISCDDGASEELNALLAGAIEPGATVYLDNLGELPIEAQARLEKRVREVEAAHGVNGTPMRFIGGVQPRVFEWVDRGEMRGTLLEAIGVVRIDLAPLRQRPQDIPLLAVHFLKQACRAADVPPKMFSRSALTLLSAMPWPGNADELRSLTDRLAVLIPRGIVYLEDVLANVRLDKAEAMGRPRETLREARERFERDYVTSVLQHHKGRIAEAAKDLGIERTNLYRKIKHLGVQWAIRE